MTKTETQQALLAAYVKRDAAQEQLDAATREVAALRNLYAGMQIEEARSKTVETERPSAQPANVTHLPKAEKTRGTADGS